MKYIIVDGTVLNENGKALGHKGKDGYLITTLALPNGTKTVRIHQYIWEKTNGLIPKGYELDHIDGNKLNNRIDNLRLVNRSQNQFNKKKQKNNKSGIKGVSWDSHAKSWLAQIRAYNKLYYLGRYKDISQAKKVVEEKRAELHGKFARNI